jgi:hypothetical protein
MRLPKERRMPLAGNSTGKSRIGHWCIIPDLLILKRYGSNSLSHLLAPETSFDNYPIAYFSGHLNYSRYKL